MSDLLTVQEAADRRGCTVNAIRVAISLGRLPSTGVGSDRRVKREDVDAMPPARGFRSCRRRRRPDGPSGMPPADVDSLLAAFTPEERECLSYALYFAALSGRLYPRQKPVIRRLMLRFGAAADENERVRQSLLRAADGIPDTEEVPEPPAHLDRREYPRAA